MEPTTASAIQCIHQVPGRLRARVAGLKGSRAAAIALEGALEGKRGIKSAEVSMLTGCVVVRYDRTNTTATAVLGILNSTHGTERRALTPAVHSVSRKHAPVQPRMRRAVTKLPPWLMQKMLEKAFEIALERSVVMLIAAIL
ncbi:MAG: hypothetical protein QOJ99_4132 [Bryobacterales bacterium]|jgi:hypothetical protein|nr:hypothetical protein [Bryobacterales bacterium]